MEFNHFTVRRVTVSKYFQLQITSSKQLFNDFSEWIEVT